MTASPAAKASPKAKASSAVKAFWNGPQMQRLGRTARLWVENFAPRVLAGAVFLAGVVLLLSGATPEIDSRMEWLRGIVPDPVLELSHLAGSAVGVGLLILARGPAVQRLDGAWWTAMLLLAAGIAASLLKGLDYEEALLLSGVAAVLWFTRHRFYRRASLLDLRSSRAWVIAVVLSVGAAVLVSIASYRDVQYAHELWWQFAFDDDAPRVMRAALLTVILAAGYAVLQLFSPRREEPELPTPESVEKAAQIALTSRDTLAYLALLGDKQLLFAEAGDAFIMYQRSGRSMVALGDPSGNPERFDELAWRFREIADRNSCWPVFYQVSSERLPLYLDLGLALAKLGEEARVPLHDFSLEGPRRADLRVEHRRGPKQGASFVVLTPAEVEAALPRLHQISEQWLLNKSTAEKGFSVGRFEDAYLRRFHCGCVMREGPDRGLRQLVAAHRARGILGRPDALQHRGAQGRDGLSVPRGAGAVGPRPGLPVVQLRHGAAVRPGEPSAGAVLAQAGHRRAPVRRHLLQHRGPAPLQGQVQPAVAPALPGLPRRPGTAARAAGHRRADRGRGDGGGVEIKEFSYGGSAVG